MGEGGGGGGGGSHRGPIDASQKGGEDRCSFG